VTGGTEDCPDGTLVERHDMALGAYGTYYPAGIEVVDWDGDGDNDMFIGTLLSEVIYLEQVGSGPTASGVTPLPCLRHLRYSPNMPGQRAVKVSGGEDACQARCARVAGCAHFTFFKRGWFTNCLLHDDAATPRYQLGLYSGPPECGQGTLVRRFGEDNPFHDLGTLNSNWWGNLNYGGNFLSPEVADVDGDGDLDAIIGTSWRSFELYLNEGGKLAQVPKEQSPLGAISLDSWWGSHHSQCARVADFDGDGTQDIIMVGSFPIIYRTTYASAGDWVGFVAGALGGADCRVASMMVAIIGLALGLAL